MKNVKKDNADTNDNANTDNDDCDPYVPDLETSGICGTSGRPQPWQVYHKLAIGGTFRLRYS